MHFAFGYQGCSAWAFACDELRAEVFYGFSNLRHGTMSVDRLICPSTFIV